MSEFSVQINSMNAAMDTNSSLARQLASASDTVNRIKSGLTFELRQRSRIDSRLRQAADALDDQSAAMNRAAKTGSQVISLYTQTERAAAGVKGGSMSWVNATGTTAVVSPGGQISDWFMNWWNSEKENWNDSETFLDWLETFLKLDKNGVGGILGNGLSYIDAMFEFFGGDKKGITGAQALCNLTDKSVSMWTAAYNYLKDFYHEAGDFFGKSGQSVVGWVSLAGAFVGSMSEFMEAVDFKDKGIGEIISGFLDYAKASVPVLKAAYTLDHIGDAASLAKMKTGPFSALGIYTSIAESGLAFASQMSESIDRYSKDGVWDAQDTAAVMVDSSVNGLYGLANGLTFGLADVFLDAVNTWSGGKPLAEGETYADRAAEGLKEGAKMVGQAIGRKILDIRKALGW